ncbi:MAG TPA: protein kinase, partial [Gemmataceae bacterium]
MDRAARDQEARWRRGERVSAETYFARDPELADPSARLDLIYAEIILRESFGERPTAAEYAFRFPALADRIRPLFSLHQVLVSDSTPAADDPPPSDHSPDAPAVDLPGYVVLAELGRGGMGVVYKARHLRLGRVVAVKMLPPEGSDPAWEARLRREAEALARVQHANIVQVFEVGTCDGRPFLALEYVAGGTLADRLRDGPIRPVEVARLIRTAAAAAHAAHEAGVVHRDLKPANILIAADDQPKLTDFGLAKRLDQAAVSRTGEMVGTPAYMAPEQAAGRGELGPAADVYALGAILYECLTGRPPFQADTPFSVLTQVASADPIQPSRLRPGIPRDLEAVCLKCLEKDAHRRYPTAAALVDDLGRFLTGQPTAARPLSPARRATKLVRRHPVPAVLVGLVVISLAGGLAGVLWQWQQAVAARGGLQTALDAEAAQRRHAEENLYIGQLAQAVNLWDGGDAATARALLAAMRPPPGRDDPRGWEWHYLARLFRPEVRVIPVGHWVYGLVPLPDRPDELAVAVGKPRMTTDDVPVPADGRPGFLRPADPDAADRPGPPLPGAATAVAAQQADPLVAWGANNGRVVLVDRTTNRPVRTIVAAPPDMTVTGVAFTSDGSRIAVGTAGGPLRVFNVADGAPVGDHRPMVGGQCVLAVNPAGTLLACGGNVGRIRLFDLPAWQVGGDLPSTGDGVSAVGFAPTGRLLAAGCTDGTVVLWDTADRREVRRLYGTVGSVYAVAFHPDGKTLAVAGADRAVRVWDVATGRETGVLRGHEAPVRSLAFVGRGDRLASGGQDGTVRVWDMTRSPRGRHLSFHGRLNDVAFSASPVGLLVRAAHLDGGSPATDQQPFWTGQTSGGVGAWTVTDGRIVGGGEIPVGSRRSYPVRYTAFVSGGRQLAAIAADEPNQVCLWDADMGFPAGRFRRDNGPVLTVAADPAGRRLAWAAAAPGGGVDLHWRDGDVDGGPIRLDVRSVRALAVDPVGGRIAAITASERPDGESAVWAVEPGGKPPRELARGRDMFGGLTFSPDGRLLAVAAGDEVYIHRSNPWERTHTVACPPATTCLAFSPDGRRLAAVGYDGVVTLYDPAAG